ncbi:Crp/Fnr family transcriptional regulator [Arcicella sp. LKC2W]|uniref:Crp/Fnr family transcriptional regulator n=1 Tax=Arcicella sp. LKC2W TaxID=2984198 RepID=UPI002B20906D|nr:Crp/Fnr family transcriptional regulator [Arcicella sp. LKC2W]MEA5461107.1 Crp/Fnr family transcriptional regulator [Arcicella sp. LKC2W]
MFDKILNSLAQFILLDKSEQDYFVNKLQVRQFKKKELILQEGQVCDNVYFINKGCLRYFYNIDGEENTAQFFFENTWYTDFDSFLTGRPSRLNIQTLEKTDVLMLSSKNIHEIYDEMPKFEKLGRKMAENAFLGVRSRNEMLENFTAEERYLNLIKERPKVMERIPQHYIASYIGIKPESLSRIRKNIMEK